MSTAKRKQEAQKADELIRQFAERDTASDAEQSAAPEADEAQAAPQDQGAEVVGESQADDGAQEGQASGEDAPLQSREETADYWRHKYKSLDGILRRKDHEIEQMRDIVAAMQQSVSNLEQRQAATDQEASNTPLVSKEDEDTFGSDLVDLVRRVTQDTLRAVKEELRSEFRDLQSQVQSVSSTVKMTAKERFEAKLDAHDKTWRSLDADPNFIAWLQASPVRIREWATAVNELDTESVIEKFDTYKLLTQQVRVQEEAPRNERRKQLEKQVAPGKSRAVASTHQAEDDKRTWTSSDIKRAFSERKNYPAQEWAKLEREIFAAQAEGRVDYSK